MRRSTGVENKGSSKFIVSLRAGGSVWPREMSVSCLYFRSS